MCGINGLIQFCNKLNYQELSKKLELMNKAIYHRGPDDSGTYVSENVAFGMTRLSIIDLANGHQPIFNEDKSKFIIFNGEIYNHKQLKEILITKHHVFRTTTDTE